ncbi:GNAT family N-acetyltransferase [Cohnella suwonensis]|uniref:GNAT family N-acetyltransferase n=1 Tax=Cohnella suwonensis TaxID=696072 RepID=A0ABW0LWT9_9BACL
MYSFVRLNNEQLSSYAELTFPSLREELLSESREPSVIAIGAMLFGKPIGLVWGKYWARYGYGQIKTIFVIDKYRRRGIGGSLLREMELAFEQLGCKEMRFDYRHDQARSLIWERLFQQTDWSHTYGSLHTFTVSVSQLMELEWVRRQRLPERFSFMTWSELKAEEQAFIEAGKDVWYPASMTPLHKETSKTVNLSVGLRYGADIIGWMIIHEHDEDTVIGDRMYVRQPFQAQGRAVSAMIEAVRRIAEAGFRFARFDVSGNNKQMLRFVERKMKPCLVDSYEVVRLNKRLAVADYA